MTDLSKRPHLTTSPLGVDSYFDEARLARERARIFAAMPRYLGHRLAVPNVGDYYALPQEGDGRLLVHTDQGIELVSNVCRHRQAIIHHGRGSLLEAGPPPAGNIVCPIHRWTYSPSGKLLGAPQVRARSVPGPAPTTRCRNGTGCCSRDSGGARGRRSGRSRLRRARSTSTAMCSTASNCTNATTTGRPSSRSTSRTTTSCPSIPGLGKFVTCDDLAWELRPAYSVQTVGVSPRLGAAGSPVFERWHRALLEYQNGAPIPYGAIWLTYYPTVMVEWYPHTLTVSTLIPQGPQKTLNVVEFFYPEAIAAFEREFVHAQQTAYLETCREDDEIAERMDAGRLALLRRGEDAAGPYQIADGRRHAALPRVVPRANARAPEPPGIGRARRTARAHFCVFFV